MAALDIATGAVIGKCYKRCRATEFFDFPKRIHAAVSGGPDVHHATELEADIAAFIEAYNENPKPCK